MAISVPKPHRTLSEEQDYCYSAVFFFYPQVPSIFESLKYITIYYTSKIEIYSRQRRAG